MKFLIDNDRIYSYAMGQPAIVGGAERQQWLLARALARRGHQVVVYAPADQCSGGSAEVRCADGVVFKGIRPAAPVLAWPKMLARERPDWWYWRTSDYYLGLLVPMAHAFGTRVAFACAFDSDCRPRQALVRRPWLWPLYARGLRTADRILVQHAEQLRLLPPRLQRRARWVPSIAGVAERAGSRENYVAWVGVLREPKRPHLLVEIAEKLPQVRFVVCGAPSLHRTRPEYAASIVEKLHGRPNIDYRGQVPPAEAQRVISRAALVLSTSELEGFPNTFLQAWGSGVPVVSLGLDPGGVMSLTAAGIVARDTDDCAGVILRLLDDSLFNAELGDKGYDYVQQTHNEDQVMDQFLHSLD